MTSDICHPRLSAYPSSIPPVSTHLCKDSSNDIQAHARGVMVTQLDIHWRCMVPLQPGDVQAVVSPYIFRIFLTPQVSHLNVSELHLQLGISSPPVFLFTALTVTFIFSPPLFFSNALVFRIYNCALNKARSSSNQGYTFAIRFPAATQIRRDL